MVKGVHSPVVKKKQMGCRKRPHKEGDLILLIDDLKPRNMWNLGRIEKVYKYNSRNERIADIKVNKTKSTLETTIPKRPSHKLILLRRKPESLHSSARGEGIMLS